MSKIEEIIKKKTGQKKSDEPILENDDGKEKSSDIKNDDSNPKKMPAKKSKNTNSTKKKELLEDDESYSASSNVSSSVESAKDSDKDNESTISDHTLCLHCAQYPCVVETVMKPIVTTLQNQQEEYDKDNLALVEKIHKKKRYAAYQFFTYQQFGQMMEHFPEPPKCCLLFVRFCWPSPNETYSTDGKAKKKIVK